MTKLTQKEKNLLYEGWLNYCKNTNFKIMSNIDKLEILKDWPKELSYNLLSLSWKSGPEAFEKTLKMVKGNGSEMEEKEYQRLSLVKNIISDYAEEFDDDEKLLEILRIMFKYYPPSVSMITNIMSYSSYNLKENKTKEKMVYFFHDYIKEMVKESESESNSESNSELIKKVDDKYALVEEINGILSRNRALSKFYLNTMDTPKSMYKRVMSFSYCDEVLKILMDNYELPDNFWDLASEIIYVETIETIIEHPRVKEVPVMFFTKVLEKSYTRNQMKQLRISLCKKAIELGKLKVDLSKPQEDEVIKNLDDEILKLLLEKSCKKE